MPLRDLGPALIATLRAYLCVLAMTLAFSSPAVAQGFAVQPMRMETAPRPGESFELPLEINNTSVSGTQTVELRLVELSQTAEGNWQVIEPGTNDASSHVASALEWITLATDTLELEAASTVETNLSIDVPRSAQGAYFAALIAETPRPADTAGLVVRVRFLIPIATPCRLRGRAEAI